jgi:hypothetical protein
VIYQVDIQGNIQILLMVHVDDKSKFYNYHHAQNLFLAIGILDR